MAQNKIVCTNSARDWIKNIARGTWRCQIKLVIITAVLLVVVCRIMTMQNPCKPCLQNNPTLPASMAEPDISSNVIYNPLKVDLRLGRWDNSRVFKIFDYTAIGDLYCELSATRNVCLASQTSIESLHEIINIAEHWSGPISLAVFIAGDEMRLFQAFVIWMLNCRPEMYARIVFHIVTPADRLAEFGPTPDWAWNCTAEHILLEQISEETVLWKASNLYPQNLMRNLARKNCQTKYVYMVDVDIVPCIGMADSLEKFLSTNDCDQCAFVVPTYELDWSASFPDNKSQLIHLVKKKLALPFHKKVFVFNQLSSELHKWEALDGKEPLETQVSHNVSKYRMQYEPFYVAPDTVPPHDERFVGYGFTRNSQVLEMFLAGYQFKVLSPIFTIHWGIQTSKRPRWRKKQVAKNFKKYKIFKKELSARYGKNPSNFTKTAQDVNIGNKQTSVLSQNLHI